jgi:hypothetical protein
MVVVLGGCAPTERGEVRADRGGPAGGSALVSELRAEPAEFALAKRRESKIVFTIRNDSGPAYPGSIPVQKVVGQLGLDPVVELTAAYEFLRRLEHRLQYLDDAQTHSLPEAAADQAIIADVPFLGPDRAAESVDQPAQITPALCLRCNDRIGGRGRIC